MPNASASPTRRWCSRSTVCRPTCTASTTLHRFWLPTASVKWSRSTYAAAAAVNTQLRGNLRPRIPYQRHVRGGNASRTRPVRLGRLVARGLDRHSGGEHQPQRIRRLGLIDHAGRSDEAAVAAVLAGLNRLDLDLSAPEEYVTQVELVEPDPAVHRFLAALLHLRIPPNQQGGLPRRRSRRSRAGLAAIVAAPDHARMLVRCVQPLNGGLVVPDDVAADIASTVPTLPSPTSTPTTSPS